MDPRLQPNQQPSPAAGKKLNDFNGELQALCDKYQYDLLAVIKPVFNKYGALEGQVANLIAFNKSPQDIQPQGMPTPPNIPVTPPQPPVVPTDQTAPGIPVDPNDAGNIDVIIPVDDTKKNEVDPSVPETNPNPEPVVTVNPSSTDVTNQPVDPTPSIPDNPTDPNAAS